MKTEAVTPERASVYDAATKTCHVSCGCVYDEVTRKRIKKCELIEHIPDEVIAFYEPDWTLPAANN